MLKIFNLMRNNYEVMAEYKYFKIGTRLYEYKNFPGFERENIKLKAILALQEYRSDVITNDFQYTVRHRLLNSRLYTLAVDCQSSFISFAIRIASLDIFTKKHPKNLLTNGHFWKIFYK